jgi:hypothetical protein
MQVATGIGLLLFTLFLAFLVDWGVPNIAERLGLTLIAYSRRSRRRQEARARMQEEQLIQFVNTEVST